MDYQAICDKCKLPVVVGFDLETTEKIVAETKECAYCGVETTKTIEKMEAPDGLPKN